MDDHGNSEARIGWGSEFWLANAQGQLVELDEVTDVALPEEMADDVEVTHMKSPNKRKEYRPGLIAPGDGTVKLNYVPGSPTDILVREAKGKVRAFKTTLPDDTGAPAWKVEGFLYIKGRTRAIPLDNRMTTDVSVRFTGPSIEAEIPAQAGN